MGKIRYMLSQTVWMKGTIQCSKHLYLLCVQKQLSFSMPTRVVRFWEGHFLALICFVQCFQIDCIHTSSPKKTNSGLGWESSVGRRFQPPDLSWDSSAWELSSMHRTPLCTFRQWDPGWIQPRYENAVLYCLVRCSLICKTNSGFWR